MITGIIGTGNMGTILLQSFIESSAVRAQDLLISNRTLHKAQSLAAGFPGINVSQSSSELAKEADLLFLCVKPHEMFPLIKILEPHLTSEKCLVSITSPISIKQLEATVPCSCARFIPSITNRALAGATLLTFGESCSPSWRNHLQNMASVISKPLEIDNDYTRVSSDIVSCGPAFFSFIARQFIEAAVDHTGISTEAATQLTESMLIGLGELLQQKHYSLPALQEKVCVKGGITGEGIKVLENELGDVFKHVFQATHRKFEEDLKGIEKQFGASYY